MSSLLQSARVSTRLLQLTRRANHVLRKSPLPNRTDVPREEQRSAGAAPNAHSSSARADPGEAQAASLCLPPLPSSQEMLGGVNTWIRNLNQGEGKRSSLPGPRSSTNTPGDRGGGCSEEEGAARLQTQAVAVTGALCLRVRRTAAHRGSSANCRRRERGL